MSLTLADKLALIYTSAGSQRQVAAFVGLTHQTVGRILHAGMLGRSLAYYEKRPDLVHAVEAAFEIHTDLARGVAVRHQIPFHESVPIYAERMALRRRAVVVDGRAVFVGEPAEVKRYMAGKIVVRRDERGEVTSAHKMKPSHVGRAVETILRGERVNAAHLHWISDVLRDKWIAAQQRSGRFVSASVGSVVNRRAYNNQASERAKTKRRTVEAAKYSDVFTASKEAAVRVYTSYTPMDKRHSTAGVLADINSKLRTRHEPAIGQTGTSFADSILLQLDTRAYEAKSSKATGNRRSAGKRSPKK